jgi:hypothetical protein
MTTTFASCATTMLEHPATDDKEQFANEQDLHLYRMTKWRNAFWNSPESLIQ